MLFVSFHACCRYRPDRCVQIELRPLRSDRFTGARKVQDRMLERARGSALLCAQILREGRGLAVRQRGMVLNTLPALILRQHLPEIPPPACRVVARAIGPSLRIVENLLDAAAQPYGCLALRVPDRLQNTEHMPDVNSLHWQGHDRLRVGLQGVFPLLGVLGVPPTVPLFGDVLVSPLSQSLVFPRPVPLSPRV